MSLLQKSEALYYLPESIGSPDGAHCGICWKFNEKSNLCVEVDGAINGPRGICGLYVNGLPVGELLDFKPTRKVSKAEAGYSDAGPTHCGNCDEMVVRRVYSTSPCKKVVGLVDGRSCCNVWQPGK